MPQRNVTTSTPLGYTIATMQTLVTHLYSSMVTGGPIVAGNLPGGRLYSPPLGSYGIFLNQGSGYTPGVYPNVPLTGGSGKYATVTVIVSGGGIVTSAGLTDGGIGYQIGDILSVSSANIGGTGSGLAIQVTNIRANRIIDWKTLGYDLWRTHTHTAQDRTGIDTFGNVTVYGVAGTHVTATTGQPQANNQPAISNPAGIATDQQINVADINALISIANQMRVHSHVITDAVGATFPVVVIADATYTATNTGANATATASFQNNGVLVGADAGVVPGQWINMHPVDLATAASYDIYVQHTGGSAPAGSALNTWLNLGTTRSWSITAVYVGGPSSNSSTLAVQIRDASTLVVVDTATITIAAFTDDYIPPPPITCFPADSQVLMSDGSWKAIQTIQVGDMVMGMSGPTAVTEMDRPLLGQRKILRFADNSLRWSEEHAMWTRDASQSQWWWSANRKLWLREADIGAIGGLADNQSMRTGDQAVEWAHIDGWKANQIIEEPPHNFNTRLYLPRTSGSPIIVNGYVVGAGVNQTGYDYSQLDWNVVQASLPVVQPIPTV
jgi:hypothetical protein